MQQRGETPKNDQPWRHEDPGAGQAQGLPLQGATMRMIIWNKTPMCQPVLNHPSLFSLTSAFCIDSRHSQSR